MTLYEDDGVSFDYEKGAFTRIACSWNDGSRTLSLKSIRRGKDSKGSTTFSADRGSRGEQEPDFVGGSAAIGL